MQYTKLHGPDGQLIILNGGTNRFASLEKEKNKDPFNFVNTELSNNFLNNNINGSVDKSNKQK